MKRSTFGALAAGAVLSLMGTTVVVAQAQAAEDAKGCYRTECGKSVKGHEGKCGGTKVDAIADEAACTAAGGAWTTEADAAKYKK
jgi:uncharacterized low-complexity protein